MSPPVLKCSDTPSQDACLTHRLWEEGHANAVRECWLRKLTAGHIVSPLPAAGSRPPSLVPILRRVYLKPALPGPRALARCSKPMVCSPDRLYVVDRGQGHGSSGMGQRQRVCAIQLGVGCETGYLDPSNLCHARTPVCDRSHNSGLIKPFSMTRRDWPALRSPLGDQSSSQFCQNR